MTIFINPGSGPVPGATHENAVLNVKAFKEDLERDPAVISVELADLSTEDDGRWLFSVRVNGQKHEVEMPGLPLREVNYGADPNDDIWDFPRLYVDGGSWVWPFALNACGPEDDE